jgi:hypothetical protein
MIAHRFGGRLIEGMPLRAIDLHPRLAGAVDSWNALGEAECTSVFEAIQRRVDELAQQAWRPDVHRGARDGCTRFPPARLAS